MPLVIVVAMMGALARILCFLVSFVPYFISGGEFQLVQPL